LEERVQPTEEVEAAAATWVVPEPHLRGERRSLRLWPSTCRQGPRETL